MSPITDRRPCPAISAQMFWATAGSSEFDVVRTVSRLPKVALPEATAAPEA
jgi:hypothetical protein